MNSDKHKEEPKSWRRRIYDFFVKWWIVSTAIASFPSGYSFFLQFFGRNLGIILEDGTMPCFWLFFSGVTLFLSFLFVVLRFHADVVNQRKSENAVTVYREIIKSGETVSNDRRVTFLDIIRKGEYRDIAQMPLPPYDNLHSGLNPAATIKAELVSVRILLSKLFDIESTNVSIDVFYRDEGGQWVHLSYLDATNHEDSENIQSEFYAGLGWKSVFFPDKRNAQKAGCYKPDEMEAQAMREGKGLIGSIFCEDISINLEGKKLFPALFYVNTYGRQVCAEGDEPAEKKVLDLFRGIESDIKLELTRLCVYEHMGIRTKRDGSKTQAGA